MSEEEFAKTGTPRNPRDIQGLQGEHGVGAC